jgi:hypothetical protein
VSTEHFSEPGGHTAVLARSGGWLPIYITIDMRGDDIRNWEHMA